MDTTAASTARPGGRKGRPNYPTDFKLRLAQQACEPGVSVSRLAREHGINANMLFKWRQHYRAGLLGSVPTSPLLLPVTIADAPAASTSHATLPGRIEIVIADAIVRIDGTVDPATVRAILQGLQP
jgi:transposase